jgi:hypothetical protein
VPYGEFLLCREPTFVVRETAHSEQSPLKTKAKHGQNSLKTCAFDHRKTNSYDANTAKKVPIYGHVNI